MSSSASIPRLLPHTRDIPLFGFLRGMNRSSGMRMTSLIGATRTGPV